MNIEKKLNRLEKKMKKSKKIKVVTLKRKHFKKDLSSTRGFGYQDMRKQTKKLFNELVTRGYNVSTEPVDINNMVIDLYVIR